MSTCDSDGLELHVGKTKEMIIDFRRERPSYDPVNIKGTEVEVVPQYNYLGSTITNNLSWAANIDKLTSKGMKRMYHMRKLREFNVRPDLLAMFYKSIIESAVTFGVAVWGGSVTKKERRKLARVRRCACRVVKSSLPRWEDLYEKKLVQLARKIVSDNDHPLNNRFVTLPSGRRLRQCPTRTQRFKNSFVPQALSKLNSC